MTDPYAYDTYVQRAGETFTVVEGDERLDLELVSVTAHSSSERVMAFGLHFTGPPAPILPQRIYRMEHDDLGVLDIFIVPIAADEDRATYEAIFNN